MRRPVRLLVVPVLLVTALTATTTSPQAQTCQPGVVEAFLGPRSALYQSLVEAIGPSAGSLIVQLAAVTDAPSYDALLATANAVAAGVPTGRLVISLADGTVVLDTSRDDHTAAPESNSFQHFVDKTIGENQHSRVAVLAAQQYPCGFGLETGFSSAASATEAVLALRAGSHLDSLGTLTLSRQIPVAPPPVDISIVNFAFTPSPVTVPVGTTVTWTNNDLMTHTSTSATQVWDSGLLSPGQSFSFTFTTPGTFTYRCSPHPFMTGTIVVQ
jgi:plastocyanin